jgi:hypothetical protein
MTKPLPAWALQAATPDDHGTAQEAHRQGRLAIKWPDHQALRAWAKQQRWPTPLFDFERGFIAHMLASPANFALAVGSSGVEVSIPRRSYTLTDDQLRELDALYAARSPGGRPSSWGALVEELREVRRAVEAGVAVTVEGDGLLRSWQEFYQWAHGRYHMLEDGADRWIGDDS